jgi:hypothetical protein
LDCELSNSLPSAVLVWSDNLVKEADDRSAALATSTAALKAFWDASAEAFAVPALSAAMPMAIALCWRDRIERSRAIKLSIKLNDANPTESQL